jgi:hypothetical protein
VAAKDTTGIFSALHAQPAAIPAASRAQVTAHVFSAFLPPFTNCTCSNDVTLYSLWLMRSPAAKKRRLQAAESPGNAQRALNWLNSYPTVAKWMRQYDILQLIDSSGGFAIVDNFLPQDVALGAIQILENIPARRWNDTAADEDYTVIRCAALPCCCLAILG